MKALVYEKAHTLDDFGITLSEVAEPTLREQDILVEVRAVGINPGETLIRRTRSAEPGSLLLLGWEFAGIVVRCGPEVRGFQAGDRVFGTGDVSRDGCWAERVAVDHRIVGRIPDSLSFADAASLPVGAITAWEAMFRDRDTLPFGVERVLIIGGAGAVGSMATQLLKATTNAFVVSTASRSDSNAWCRKMGADLVVDHTGDVPSQLSAAHFANVDLVLSTAGTVENMAWIAKVLRPFGHLSVVDGTTPLDASPLVTKSASLHTEMIFSRILDGSGLHRQGDILKAIAALVTERRLSPIAATRLAGLSARAMRIAHEQVERRRTIGKVIIVF